MAVIESLNRWIPAGEFEFDCPMCATRNMRIYRGDPRADVGAVGHRAIVADRGDEYHVESDDGVFVATFRCRNADCRQTIAVGGDWAHWVNDGDEQALAEHGTMVDVYRTRFVHPPVMLFRVPPKTPKTVTDSVRAASAVVWVDAPAAAARLRTAVEQLLDHKRIRRRGLQLHRRLLLAMEDPRLKDVAVLLFAVKWIGNDGAHDDKLTTEQVLEAAQILDEALRQLYDTSGAATRRMAAAIHRRNLKVPSKKKKANGSSH